jgi:alkylation response protein AidB-like acyl-CoA dehydrogenase
MATDLEASRLMVRHGARLIEEKSPNYTMYCAMAK